MTKSIQRIEFSNNYGERQHCPFCGQLVLDLGSEAFVVEPCPHTLFIASDEGFEYRSARFDQNVGIVGRSDDDLRSGEGWDGFDALTDGVTLPDSVKFARYDGAPSFMGGYVGFAPMDEE
jgi:hypothetical protein